jgi:succinyl-CoA synthetase beta subunit
MKIHEYQAKAILARHGVPVPLGEVVFSAADAALVATRLGGGVVVVKAQIHAGGRGKGGGVKVVKDRDAAQKAANDMIGMRLVTIQTGPAGQVVQRVLVEQGLKIKRELYLGLVLDRATERPVLMASQEGGVEIEKVAAETPEKIFKEHFDPAVGLESYQVRKLCKQLGLEGATVRSAEKFMKALCRLYVNYDCTLVEINPLVVTKGGELVALDAKITFDDNAMFRHKDVAEYRDLSEENPAELRAGEAGLSYVALEGNIGCLVNGAGLAMSTMDIIKLHGGQPANFLDVGGGAKTEQVTEAFRILLGDKDVKAVLVNIFGGIMQCTTIAKALLEAYKTVGFNVPLVVRLEGTEVKEGRKILADSGVNIIAAEDLTDAAKKVVAAAG